VDAIRARISVAWRVQVRMAPPPRVRRVVLPGNLGVFRNIAKRRPGPESLGLGATSCGRVPGGIYLPAGAGFSEGGRSGRAVPRSARTVRRETMSAADATWTSGPAVATP